jgi:hypothetical protein
MKKTMFVIDIIFILLVAYGISKILGTVKLKPGIKAPNIPFQSDIVNPEEINFKDITIIPLADFSMDGKILSKKRYWFGRETKLSKYDFAMGWRKMSDENFLENIRISQSRRWYFWRAKNMNINFDDISVNSANMHLIPANKEIAKKIRRAKIGQIIHLEGYLVKAMHKSGWYWKSSLSRKDTGAHACEVFYVKEFEVLISNKKDDYL